MEITSEYVGRKSKPYRVTLTPRRTMNYAAATLDDTPAYYADDRPEGMVVPPMLAVALTWHMAANLDSFWKMDDFPRHVVSRQVHYSEFLEWHQPMRPDDTLEITAEVTAVLPHRAGTHLIVRHDAVRDGELVFTEWAGAMLRDVKCTDGGKGKENVPTFAPFSRTGDDLWEKVIPVHPLASHLYDGCGDLHFPIHTSQAFAKSVGLPGIILHGTATLAMAVREIVRYEADGDPERVASVRCNFTGMVIPGTEIVVRAQGRNEHEAGTDIHFLVLNAEDKRAIRHACVTLRK
jgi:acyl dehydratase